MKKIKKNQQENQKITLKIQVKKIWQR